MGQPAYNLSLTSTSSAGETAIATGDALAQSQGIVGGAARGEDPARQWIDLDRASRLCNMTERHLRRLCGSRWAAEGKARMIQESGVRSFWQIRGDATPELTAALAAAGVVAGAGTGLARVETIQAGSIIQHSRAAKPAMEKAAIVARWERAVAAARTLGIPELAATTKFLADLDIEFRSKGKKRGPSQATLYNWKRYAKSGEGISGLVDGRQIRGFEAGKRRAEDPFLQAVKRFWLHKNQRKLPMCYNGAVMLAQENGWEIRSLSEARRFINAIDVREKVLRREGREALLNKCLPHETRDYSTLESNEIWVSDHHQFDVWVKIDDKLDPKTQTFRPVYVRCWLTVWMDMRSRKIVAWAIRRHSPNHDVIIETLSAGCLSHYVPLGVFTDNGDDYDARALTGQTKAQHQAQRAGRRKSIHAQPIQHVNVRDAGGDDRLLGIYAALGVTHTRAIPYNAKSKPVERFFNTVCERFAKLWETYCGNSPQNRPEGLEDRMHHAPPFEDFVAAFADWVEADYNRRPHTGDAMDGQTPEAVWEANIRRKRVAPRELLDLLMQPRYERRVSQLGVDHQKIKYGKYVLNAYVGQDVYVRVNNADVTAVSVWSIDDKFICMAPSNTPLPANATSQHVREAMAEQRRLAKVLSQAFEARLKIHCDVPSLVLHKAIEDAEAQRARGRKALPPGVGSDATLVPVRSDLEAQLEQLQEAQEPLRTLGDGGSGGMGSFSMEAAQAAFEAED